MRNATELKEKSCALQIIKKFNAKEIEIVSQTSINIRDGVSMASLIRRKNKTASRPSTMR
jgi:hypothetical protein